VQKVSFSWDWLNKAFMKNLSQALSFGGILNDEEITYITGCFEEQLCRPGDHFFTPGQISDRLGFVDAGIFRVYIANGEDEEATKYFLRKNQFMMDVESFYNNTPTDSGIQAVTEARLLLIDRAGWNTAVKRSLSYSCLLKALRKRR
jgi:CRP-like cAMP-binding protein